MSFVKTTLWTFLGLFGITAVIAPIGYFAFFAPIKITGERFLSSTYGTAGTAEYKSDNLTATWRMVDSPNFFTINEHGILSWPSTTAAGEYRFNIESASAGHAAKLQGYLTIQKITQQIIGQSEIIVLTDSQAYSGGFRTYNVPAKFTTGKWHLETSYESFFSLEEVVALNEINLRWQALTDFQPQNITLTLIYDYDDQINYGFPPLTINFEIRAKLPAINLFQYNPETSTYDIPLGPQISIVENYQTFTILARCATSFVLIDPVWLIMPTNNFITIANDGTITINSGLPLNSQQNAGISLSAKYCIDTMLDISVRITSQSINTVPTGGTN